MIATAIVSFAGCEKDEDYIQLDQTSLTLPAGTSQTLKATLSSSATEQSVTWSSENTSVAAVSSSGKVTAVAEGTATIVAKAGSHTATCAVTVIPNVAVIKITLNKTTLTLEPGGSGTLVATITPSNATNKTLTWSSNKISVATVSSSGEVTAIKDGTATITATASGITATCFVTVETYSSPTDNGAVINGVKWATRNVGAPGTFAAKPEFPGMFYQWNRKIGWSAEDPLISSNGSTTWNTMAVSGDTWEAINDPSPAGWRVPTLDEINTLLNESKVTLEWTNQNDVKGLRCTDKATGASIFLPAADDRSTSGSLSLYYGGTSGNYWSSTQYVLNSLHGAYSLGFNSSGASAERNYYGTYGFSVRCVAK
ncbi:hypothetical protein FACS1894159_10580 [Bacteroidia bacterium]|nr:hypothetical protein FACS1894159_10580 [Bacteroidia bacterium]